MITGILVGDGLSKKSQWQVTSFKGKLLLQYPLEAMQESRLDEILLVLGKDYHLILNKIKVPLTKTRIVMNRRYDRGLSTYLKAAMSFVPEETEAVMIALGEYPMLTSSLLDRMIEFFQKEKAGILVPVYEKEMGQLYIFNGRYFKFIKKLLGNDLGESIIKKYQRDVKHLEVKSPGVIKGLDKIQDLESLDSGEIDRIEKEAAARDIPAPPPDLMKRGILEQIKEKIESQIQQEKQKEEKAEIPKSQPESLKTKKIEDMADEFQKVPVTKSSDIETRAADQITFQAEQEKKGKDISLKMINDLLGKGSKKTNSMKIEKKTKEKNIK